MAHARKTHPKMPRSRELLAVPFVGKDRPSEASEFSHPDVVIGLTIMAYRYEVPLAVLSRVPARTFASPIARRAYSSTPFSTPFPRTKGYLRVLT